MQFCAYISDNIGTDFLRSINVAELVHTKKLLSEMFETSSVLSICLHLTTTIGNVGYYLNVVGRSVKKK